MKKIFCFLVAGIVTINAVAQQAGRLKVTLKSVQCNKATFDDALQLDGKGDEVFFNFVTIKTDKDGKQKDDILTKRTGVYGDNTGDFPNRNNVGSALDLFKNKKGGIRDGDVFNCDEMVFSIDIEGNDVVSLVPTVWEWDPGTDPITAFSNSFNSVTAFIGSKVAEIARAARPVLGNFSDVIINGSSIQVPTFLDIFSAVAGKQGDRPIGMAANGAFSPKVVMLKSDYVQNIISRDGGYGQGILAVNYDEESLGNLRDHGNYTLLLKVEFTPKAGTVATATTPPATTTTPPPLKATTMPGKGTNKGVTFGNLLPASTIVPVSPIAGDWVGTYGDGANDGPIFFSFRFNNGSVMSTLDKNGSVLNNGNYSFANNQVSGHYDQYSFAGTLDANGRFNGTWGSGNNTSGLGKWTMTKK